MANVGFVAAFFAIGVSVVTTADEGRVALLRAIARPNPEQVKLLLDSGVSLDTAWTRDEVSSAQAFPNGDSDRAVEYVGTFPIEAVASQLTRRPKAALRMLKLLLANGVDPNLTQGIGATPLHKAARAGHAEAVELLLDYGAEVNFPTRQGIDGRWGRTPLHDALGHPAIVDLLLNNGANRSLRDSEGAQPWERAADLKLVARLYPQEIGEAELASLLRRRIATRIADSKQSRPVIPKGLDLDQPIEERGNSTLLELAVVANDRKHATTWVFRLLDAGAATDKKSRGRDVAELAEKLGRDGIAFHIRSVDAQRRGLTEEEFIDEERARLSER